MIKNIKYRKLFKIANVIVMLLFAFFVSIGGWKGNTYWFLFFIEFILGIIVFIYSIIYIIKYRKFNYIIFTPFLLIMFSLLGMYYGQRDERKIHKIANEIMSYYQEENINKDEILNYIKKPKNMEITIENNDIIIKYKNIVYYPKKHAMVYIHND
jgi:hypothetical protein